MPRDMIRYLLNQMPNDGGGAPAGAPPAPGAAPPAAGQAQGQPAGLDPTQLKGMFDEFKNSVFAETRRMVESMTGKKPKGASPAETPGDAPPAPARQPDLRRFDRASARLNLGEKALARMEAAFIADNPEDPAQWVQEYAADLGIAQQQQGAAAPPQAQPPTPNQPPAPQGGAPPNPTPHAPNPAPLGDLDRANLHPNRLTSEMVQRLGPDGVYKYTKEWFAKQGRK